MDCGKGLAQTQQPKGRKGQIPEELLVLFIVHKLGALGEQVLLSWKSSSAKGTAITCWCAGSASQICFSSCIFLLGLGGDRWGFHFYTWWKSRKCAVRKGPTSNTTEKRSRHNSLFYRSPSSIQNSLAAEPRPPPWSCVAAQPWLCIPCPAAPVRQFTDVSSLRSPGMCGRFSFSLLSE